MLNRYFRRIENLPLLLSITGEVVGFLKRIENPSIEKVLHDVNVLKFVLPNDLTIEPEQEIIYKNSRYKVTKVVQSRVGRKITEVEAMSAFIELNDKRVKKIEFVGLSLEAALNKLLAGTGWTVGSVPVDSQTHSMSEENQTVLYLIWLLATLAGYEVDFDTVNKKVNFVEKIGKETSFIFRYRKNIKEIKKTVTPVQATVIYPYGRGGLTIGSVNNGQEYLEDYSWYTDMGVPLDEAKKRFRKEYVWEDERFIYAGTLMRAAQDKLRELSRPQIAYETSVSDINAGELDIGDYCWVIDEELGIRLKVRVVRLEQYPGQEWNNKIEFNYLIPGLTDTINTGSTAQSSRGEQLILVKNQSDLTIDSNYSTVLEMNITSYASTNLQCGLTLVGQASATSAIIHAYLTFNGNRVGPYIRQSVNGWATIGVPFILAQIPEGSGTLALLIKIESGTFSIANGDAELFVKGENLFGGTTSDLPRASVVEEVTYGNLTVSENVVVTLKEASDREKFAKMANYPNYSNKPTQSDVDNFIDNVYATNKIFKVIGLSSTYLYVFTTSGSYIDVDTVNKKITSDGTMYSCESGNPNRSRGTLVDWSSQSGDVVVYETYTRE